MQNNISIKQTIQEAKNYSHEELQVYPGVFYEPHDVFPIDAMGETLQAAAEAIHRKIQAPLAICAQAVLATASLSTQGITKVNLPIGQTRPISIFFLSVAASGERKSSVDNEATKAISDYEEILDKNFQQQLKQWKKDHTIWMSRKNNQKNSSKLEEEPKKPVRPFFTVDDCTLEGLIKTFGMGQKSLGLFTSEGGQLLGGYSLNKERLMNTVSTLSKMWDGTPIKNVRASKDDIFLRDYQLSTHLMLQPDMALDFITNKIFQDQGILSRFLIVAPPSAAGTRFYKQTQPTEAALEKYNRRVTELLQISVPTLSEPTKSNRKILILTHEAEKKWYQFSNHVESLVGLGGRLELIKAFANKLPEHAIRLAAVFALFEDPKCCKVDCEFIDRAIRLVAFYAHELLRFTEEHGASKMQNYAESIRQWLIQDWSELYVSIADIQQYGPRGVRPHNAGIRQIFNLLEEEGFVIKDGEQTIKGQKRKETWKVLRDADNF